MSEAGPQAGRARATLSRALDRGWLVLVVGAAIALLCAWRATIGLSFLDDGYYAATVVRLAQGARLFVDEMFVQSLGFLVAVPFAKAWIALFGTSHIVVALRLLYVALATGAGVVSYRLLRPSFGRWASLLGAAAVFIAPAYNLLSVTYDTMAAAGLMLACLFAFACIRDGRRGYAVASGVLAAFASISYPPFALAALVLLVTFGIRARDRRMVGALLAGAAALVAVFAAWLLATTSLAELRVALDFVLAGRTGAAAPTAGEHPLSGLYNFRKVLGLTWNGIPVWAWFMPAAAMSAWASWRTYRDRDVAAPGPRSRTHGLALLLMPVALALPVLANWFATGHGSSQAVTLGSNFIIALLAMLVVPVTVGLWHARSEAHDLVILVTPAALVACGLILRLSFADVFWGSEIVGLAPLAVGFLVWWATELRREREVLAEAAGVLWVLWVLLTLLFAYTFKSTVAAPLERETIASGPYAGITTNASRIAQLKALAELSARRIGPSTRVTVVSVPGVYLTVGGIPLTNVTWHDPDLPIGQFTIDYLDRVGRWPDVVLMPRALATSAPTPGRTPDPFVTAVRQRYHVVETSPILDLAVFVPNP